MTATVATAEGVPNVFVSAGHWTSGCGEIRAARSANRFDALELVSQGVREHFGALAKGAGEGLALQRDHGSAYTADGFERDTAYLGMPIWPIFVGGTEGNGACSSPLGR